MGDWQTSNRDWSNEDIALDLPAIICTEFVADGMKQYRMAKWVDSYTISSFENHRDDSLCDKWLAPIDDPKTNNVIQTEETKIPEGDDDFLRMDVLSFSRQSLQTGEMISPIGSFTAIFVGSLGLILIIFFIIIYAIKKRDAKKSIEEKK